MQVERLSPALGAEITGVDLREAGPHDWEAIHGAFAENLVLFFPGQHLAATELEAAGRQFGALGFYPFIEGLPEAPHVFPIIKEASERKNFGEGWHSDTTYTPVPPMATMLSAVDIPPLGGDTLFANMYLAYENLSPGMQALLAPLRGVNRSSKRKGGGRSAGNQFRSVTFKNRDQEMEGIHPLVRTHPVTGRKALYLNRLHTSHIEGWTASESEGLLSFLYRHMTRPEFTCRYRWSVGTATIWDNRAAQHYALNDYHGSRREMLRLSIAGQTPE